MVGFQVSPQAEIADAVQRTYRQHNSDGSYFSVVGLLLELHNDVLWVNAG